MDVSVEEVKGCMCLAIHKLMSTSSLEGKNFMIEPSPIAASKFEKTITLALWGVVKTCQVF